jgi:WD40 repeat protein
VIIAVREKALSRLPASGNNGGDAAGEVRLSRTSSLCQPARDPPGCFAGRPPFSPTEVSAMTTARPATVSCVAVLLAAGAVLGLRAGPADDPPVPKPEPPAPAGATLIGTAQFRHTGWWSRVFLTNGGNTLLVVSPGVVVRWWDVQTGKKLHEITLKGGYQDAAFAPAADLLTVVGVHQPDGENGNSEHVLWLIDAAARKLVRTVGLPSRLGGNNQKVRVSADGKRVFVEFEGDIQVIDGKTGDELIRHKGRVNAGTLAVSRDGKLVAFGRYDVFLWRWETGEEPKKFTWVGNSGTELMQFSPDGKTLCVVPPGQLITTWDVATGRQTGSRPLRALANNLEFSPDGKTLAVASHPGASRPPEGGHAIDLLDAATWNEVGRIPLGRIGVEHVSWSRDGSRLAGVSDYRVWAWDVRTGKVLGPSRPGHEGLIAAMAFGPDGTLFTASDDHTIRSWDPATGVPGLELVHDHWVRDLAVSPDGALVVGSALRNDLRVWDARTGKPRFKLLGNGEMGGKRRVRFTADGKHLVAWGDDEFVRVWEVRNGKLLSEHSTRPPGTEGDPDDPFGDRMRFMEASFEAADVSPDGTALALSTGKGLRILDPTTGKERQTLSVGDNRPNALAFSPDAKRVAVAFQGKPVQTKLADGSTRYSTEKDYPVTVWDLASGKPLWTAKAEGNWPVLAYSPDGSRVAVVSNVAQGPSRVWVWDAATGKEAGRIELPRRGHQLAFDRTGKRLAVSFDDTTALVYNLETALRPAK